ncbi:MAG TPA: DUF5676 family membrane protein [Gemmatimonadales bacterium]|jgi:hypothetical protein|nr:DUF5676 family membrane protein [Gemmatimonadales bacterium]
MRFDTKRFAFAVAAAWAVWYAICYFLVAVAPEQTQAVLSFALHYDLTTVRRVSWAGFFGGLFLSTAWVTVFAATMGGFFNARSGIQQTGFLGWKPATPK